MTGAITREASEVLFHKRFFHVIVSKFATLFDLRGVCMSHRDWLL